jgi:hypothetical protein
MNTLREALLPVAPAIVLPHDRFLFVDLEARRLDGPRTCLPSVRRAGETS